MYVAELDIWQALPAQVGLGLGFNCF